MDSSTFQKYLPSVRRIWPKSLSSGWVKTGLLGYDPGTKRSGGVCLTTLHVILSQGFSDVKSKVGIFFHFFFISGNLGGNFREIDRYFAGLLSFCLKFFRFRGYFVRE
jgi:hypothetical protein